MRRLPAPEHGFAPTMVDELSRLRASRAVFARAESFAKLVGVPLQQWMLAPAWNLHVGCDRCAAGGETAACWGTTTCHGYTDGCGCVRCTEQQARDVAIAEQHSRPATVAGRSRNEGGL